MKKRKIFPGLVYLSLISSALMVSCEDVINVALKDASPRLVVEARITNLSDSVIVMLHKTTDYFTPKDVIAVTNGTVSLSDSHENLYPLTNNLNGIYSAANIHASPGDAFTLDVMADGIGYSAGTVMPGIVRIDTLTVDNRPDRKNENRLNIFLKDPAGIANYYQVKVFKNDTLLNNNNHYVLYNDKFYDGKSLIITINAMRFDIPRFEPKDRIKVQLINIDKMMYDYYQILRDITDEGNLLSASTPSNPPNNLNNGALGYFAAFSVSEKSITVK